jgi:hypothetical protein
VDVRQLHCFNSQSKRLLRAVTAVRYNYRVESVAIERNWMRVANLNVAKGGEGSWSCTRLHVLLMIKHTYMLMQIRFY